MKCVSAEGTNQESKEDSWQEGLNLLPNVCCLISHRSSVLESRDCKAVGHQFGAVLFNGNTALPNAYYLHLVIHSSDR